MKLALSICYTQCDKVCAIHLIQMSDWREMNRSFIKEFIEIYKRNKCLWHIKTREYTDRDLRAAGYEELLQKYRQVFPDANKEQIIRKIDSLRGSFRKEYKKVKNSIKSGATGDAVYKPRLWYYDKLLFVKDQESKDGLNDCSEYETSLPTPASAPTPPPAPIAVPAPMAILPPQPPTVQTPPAKKIKSTHPLPYKNPYSNPYSNQYPTAHENPPPPHQNQRLHQDREVHICSSCPCIAAQESEYDKIGKAWASELQKMKPEQQIYAKRAIAEIIFEGQLGALHRDSVIINHIEQRVADEASPYIVEKEEIDFDC